MALYAICDPPPAPFLEPRETCLMVVYGDDLGRKFSLPRGKTTIGRCPRRHVSIEDYAISRLHAEIRNDGLTVILSDLASRNGTYVNDVPIKQQSLHDGDRVTIGRVIFKFLDGLNRLAYHEELHRLLTIDGLTQLYNRRHLQESMDLEIRRAHHDKTPLSLLVIDIDHWDEIHETHGPLVKNSIRQQLADLLRPLLGGTTFARWGGERFVVLAPDLDGDSAHALAEKLRTIVEEGTFGVGDIFISLTISIGISAHTTEVDESVDLLKRAEECLQWAQQRGGHRIFPTSSSLR